MMNGTRAAATYDGVTYAPGARFMVVAEGARLSGWTAVPGGSRGWGQDLRPGDVLTCQGDGPGIGSDGGSGVEWTSGETVEARAFHCDLFPAAGSPWTYRPRPGILTPVLEGEQLPDQLTYYIRRDRPGEDGTPRVGWTRVRGARQAQREAAAWRGQGWAAWVVRAVPQVRALAGAWQKHARGYPGVAAGGAR